MLTSMSALENAAFPSLLRIFPDRTDSSRLHRAYGCLCVTMRGMVKTLQLAIAKATELPEAAQEQIGRELLERIDTLAQLRDAIEVGVRELDAGRGQELDMDKLIEHVHREHAKEAW